MNKSKIGVPTYGKLTFVLVLELGRDGIGACKSLKAKAQYTHI